MWKSKKDLAGHSNNTNSEFDGNSNMKRCEEICMELDDGSSSLGSSNNNSRVSMELSNSLCISSSMSKAMLLSFHDRGCRQTLHRSFDRFG